MKMFRNLSKLGRHQGGNVAMIFALALLPMLLVAGFAIDAQLAFSKQGKIQRAVDSAVLAGARMMQDVNDKEEVRKHARTYFDAIMAGDRSSLSCDTLEISFTGPEELRGDIVCNQPTTLMRLAGHEEVEIHTSGTATYGTGRVDVAFVFDISGSMNNYGRIYDLKDAAKEAADTLLPEEGSPSDGDVRIAMVAYNSMVNAGKYFEAVTGMKERRVYFDETVEEVDEEYTDREYICGRECIRRHPIFGWCMREGRYECGWQDVTKTRKVEKTVTKEEPLRSTCVYERDGDEAFTNAQPLQVAETDLVERLEAETPSASETSDNEEGFLATGYAYWDEGSRWSYPGWEDEGTACADAEPFGLSNDLDDIEDYIDDLRADGGTAGHQGVAWGWYLISEEWGDVFKGSEKPLSQSEPDVGKSMIIMTDGEFNEQFFDDQGSSTRQAEMLCDAIKDSDVIVYTIAFQAPEAGKDVLRYCASGPEFFFNAENGQELIESYNAIATSISDLRISG